MYVDGFGAKLEYMHGFTVKDIGQLLAIRKLFAELCTKQFRYEFYTVREDDVVVIKVKT